MKKVFIAFLFSTFLISFKNAEPSFSYRTYGNIANYFESKDDLLSFFKFKKGDAVAEVGAGDGQNIAGLSLLTDSVTFYAEDINSKTLNEKDLGHLLSKTKKYRKSTSNTFKLQIGNETETFLPDNYFDKIILSATFHEFTRMQEMILDLRKKLKPGGQLYILESKCLAKTHQNYTAEETINILLKHDFTLVKKDGKDLNGAEGLYRLVFAKL